MSPTTLLFLLFLYGRGGGGKVTLIGKHGSEARKLVCNVFPIGDLLAFQKLQTFKNENVNE